MVKKFIINTNSGKKLIIKKNEMIENIISIVLSTIAGKKDYFALFKKVVELKNAYNKTKTGNPQQWTNEKWLQVEVVNALWNKGIEGIPEYNLNNNKDRISIDIFIEKNKNAVYIELKERYVGEINFGYLPELMKTIIDFKKAKIPNDGCLLFISTFKKETPNCGKRIEFTYDKEKKCFKIIKKNEKPCYKVDETTTFIINEDFSLKKRGGDR